VVRAAVAVLADGAAKLAHRQDYHVVHAVAEVLVQRGEAAGEFRESIGQLALRATLIDVGIPAADLGKSDFDTMLALIIWAICMRERPNAPFDTRHRFAANTSSGRRPSTSRWASKASLPLP